MRPITGHQKPDNKRSQGQKVADLMRRAARILGMELCFHDRAGRHDIPMRWKVHRSPFCHMVKMRHSATCMAFDMVRTHRELLGAPGGRIHTCPFGATEIAVPVMSGGVYAGVLFAGQCWRGRGPAPHRGLIEPDGKNWLADRLAVARSVAREIGVFLQEHESRPDGDRRERVLSFLRGNMRRPVYLAELARHLSLSPSRARHMVREAFGATFSALVQSVKLQEAALHLRTSDLPVGEIAALSGYDDQNYFSRLFARTMGLPPRKYRQHHRSEV